MISASFNEIIFHLRLCVITVARLIFLMVLLFFVIDYFCKTFLSLCCLSFLNVIVFIERCFQAGFSHQ